MCAQFIKFHQAAFLNAPCAEREKERAGERDRKVAPVATRAFNYASDITQFFQETPPLIHCLLNSRVREGGIKKREEATGKAFGE